MDTLSGQNNQEESKPRTLRVEIYRKEKMHSQKCSQEHIRRARIT